MSPNLSNGHQKYPTVVKRLGVFFPMTDYLAKKEKNRENSW
jgi:hypothetical protein